MHKSWSADGNFHAILSWRLTFLVNSWFGCLSILFCIRNETTALGFTECGFGKIFFLPVSFLIAAQVSQLACFMSMFSTVSFHVALRLLLRCSNSLSAASSLSRIDCLLKIAFWHFICGIPTRNIRVAKTSWDSPFCNIEQFPPEHRVASVNFCVRLRTMMTKTLGFCFKMSPICFVEIAAWYWSSWCVLY